MKHAPFSYYRDYWANTNLLYRNKHYPNGCPPDDRTFVTDHDVDNGRPATNSQQTRVRNKDLKHVQTPEDKIEGYKNFIKLGTKTLEKLNKDNLSWYIKINDPDYVKSSDHELHKMQHQLSKRAEKALSKEIRRKASYLKKAQSKFKL